MRKLRGRSPKIPPPPVVICPLVSPTASGHETLHKLYDPEMDEVIPGGKHHQCQHQGQSDAKAVFLRPLTERLPAYCFGCIEQQMSTIKDRNREQIDQSKINRQHRHEPE